ncbi:MAG: hypothetical protein K6F99_08690 [Lachnospiraceae bacterium]|nr:hypothetical protein [Lachnospiraceae bacterium]
MKSKNDILKKLLPVVIIAAALVVIFYFVVNRQMTTKDAPLSKVQSVLQRDLKYNYPQSPKAVVKYYAELSQCLYLEENTDDDVKAVGTQMRLLFDEELKAQQTDAQYMSSLLTTVEQFRQDSRYIVSFSTSSASDVVYVNNDLGELASLYCMYTMRKEGQNYSDNERFLLRKDIDGHWKILGWQPAKDNS